MELFQQIWLVSFATFAVCGFIAAGLHEHAGRWRIGPWYPWVPTYLKVILGVGMLLPFIPFIAVFGVLFFVLDLDIYWRRAKNFIRGFL